MVKRVFKDDPDVQAVAIKGDYYPTQFSEPIQYDMTADYGTCINLYVNASYNDQELENLITFLEDCLTHMRSR